MNDEITEYAIRYYMHESGICSLCGNSGFIHTQGISSYAGVLVGRTNYCICPNGQSTRARTGKSADEYYRAFLEAYNGPVK